MSPLAPIERPQAVATCLNLWLVHLVETRQITFQVLPSLHKSFLRLFYKMDPLDKSKGLRKHFVRHGRLALIHSELQTKKKMKTKKHFLPKQPFKISSPNTDSQSWTAFTEHSEAPNLPRWHQLQLQYIERQQSSGPKTSVLKLPAHGLQRGLQSQSVQIMKSQPLFSISHWPIITILLQQVVFLNMTLSHTDLCHRAAALTVLLLAKLCHHRPVLQLLDLTSSHCAPWFDVARCFLNPGSILVWSHQRQAWLYTICAINSFNQSQEPSSWVVSRAWKLWRENELNWHLSVWFLDLSLCVACSGGLNFSVWLTSRGRRKKVPAVHWPLLLQKLPSQLFFAICSNRTP